MSIPVKQYAQVEPTPEEIIKYTQKKGYAPAVGMVRCTYCDKRIWNSGLGRGAHNRNNACRLREWAEGRADVHPGPTPAKPVELSPAMDATLRYFADPTPERAALCRKLKAKGATDNALRSRGLTTRITAYPYYEPTDAGHDWIEAQDNKVDEWVAARVAHSGQTVGVETVRAALTELVKSGAKPSTAAAMLRALDAKYPVVVTPIEATTEQTLDLLRDTAAAADAAKPATPAFKVGDLVNITSGTHKHTRSRVEEINAAGKLRINVTTTQTGRAWVWPNQVRKATKTYELTTRVLSADGQQWQTIAVETIEATHFAAAKDKLPTYPDGLEPGTHWRMRLAEVAVSGREYTAAGVTPTEN